MDADSDGIKVDESDLEYLSPDDGDDYIPASLADDLLRFYITFNVSNAGMKFLLDSLVKNNVPGVSTSLYLLEKKIPRNASDVIDVSTGHFSYWDKGQFELISTKETGPTHV